MSNTTVRRAINVLKKLPLDTVLDSMVLHINSGQDSKLFDKVYDVIDEVDDGNYDGVVINVRGRRS